jgi:hypothetical protein
MISFFKKDIPFQRHTGGSSIFRTSVDISSAKPTDKTRVLLALTGFDVRYSKEDHHIQRLLILPELDEHGPFGDSVDIRVELGLRDSSGNWDDPFEGTVNLGLIVVTDPDVEVDMDQSASFSFITGSGPQFKTTYHQAHQANVSHVALLRGFDISYGGEDHHLFEIDAGVQSVTLSTGTTIFDGVQSRLGLRDSSGFWDDPYGGRIEFSLLRFPSALLSVHDNGNLSVTGQDSGPKSASTAYTSPAELSDADVFVGMSGFHLMYTGGDHHVYRMISQLQQTVRPETGKTTVEIGYTGGLRDSSGSWDDPYACEGRFVVLAQNREVAAKEIRHDLLQVSSRTGLRRQFIPSALVRAR